MVQRTIMNVSGSNEFIKKSYQKNPFYASIFLMNNGRFLGIDFGTKRIGLAISDENHTLAFPKEIISNDKNIWVRLAEAIEEENIFEIVVGESTNFSGESNPVDEQIKTFIVELGEKFGLPVRKQKEFMTSIEARRYRDETKSYSNSADSSAAALILQRYLDLRSRQQGR